MEPKLYWDDVEEGSEIPTFERTTDYMSWNRYAAVNDEFVYIHMDPAAAKAAGQPDTFGMGNLRLAYLHNMLRAWIGDTGWIQKVGVQYRQLNFKGDHFTCHGKVMRKYEAGGKHLIDLDLTVMNQKGENTAPGTATVILPTRANPQPRAWE